ncbi:MAG: hypothetical protein R3Y38_07835 [Rikenellaceae bacterium]
MKTHQPHIQGLLAQVEIYHSRAIRTTMDFEALSISVEHQTNERISSSTLKRLWGYVSDKHSPRRYTLDVLSKYIGHKDFDEFCLWHSEQNPSESDFITPTKILSSDLEINTRLEIGWKPDRYLTLRYLGENRYIIESSENSKLLAGDEFSITTFMLNYPLYLPYVLRNKTIMPSFVAGKNGGLTILSLL